MTDVDDLKRMRYRSEAELAQSRLEQRREEIADVTEHLDDLRSCPKCGSLADVDSGLICDVVRCRSCRFEGATSFGYSFILMAKYYLRKIRGGSQ